MFKKQSGKKEEKETNVFLNPFGMIPKVEGREMHRQLLPFGTFPTWMDMGMLPNFFSTPNEVKEKMKDEVIKSQTIYLEKYEGNLVLVALKIVNNIAIADIRNELNLPEEVNERNQCTLEELEKIVEQEKNPYLLFSIDKEKIRLKISNIRKRNKIIDTLKNGEIGFKFSGRGTVMM